MTKAEAVAKTKILLGEIAASSTQRNESPEDFLATLRAMRDAVDRAVDLALEDVAQERG